MDKENTIKEEVDETENKFHTLKINTEQNDSIETITNIIGDLNDLQIKSLKEISKKIENITNILFSLKTDKIYTDQLKTFVKREIDLYSLNIRINNFLIDKFEYKILTHDVMVGDGSLTFGFLDKIDNIELNNIKDVESDKNKDKSKDESSDKTDEIYFEFRESEQKILNIRKKTLPELENYLNKINKYSQTIDAAIKEKSEYLLDILCIFLKN